MLVLFRIYTHKYFLSLSIFIGFDFPDVAGSTWEFSADSSYTVKEVNFLEGGKVTSSLLPEEHGTWKYTQDRFDFVSFYLFKDKYQILL